MRYFNVQCAISTFNTHAQLNAKCKYFEIIHTSKFEIEIDQRMPKTSQEWSFGFGLTKSF